MARSGVFAEPLHLETCVVDEVKRGRPPKGADLKPIAPFHSDSGMASPNVFDRITREPIGPERLKTYVEVLCRYHLSSEDKFDNGRFLDRGRRKRRRVVASGIVLIGKEANRVVSSRFDPYTAHQIQ